MRSEGVDRLLELVISVPEVLLLRFNCYDTGSDALGDAVLACNDDGLCSGLGRILGIKYYLSIAARSLARSSSADWRL